VHVFERNVRNAESANCTVAITPSPRLGGGFAQRVEEGREGEGDQEKGEGREESGNEGI